MRHGALSPMLICVFITFMKGEDNMVDLSNVIMEDGMTAKQRNALKTNKFALVYKDDNKKTVRKYPVHDERHVKAASKLFPRGVPEDYQGQVARRILKEAKKYKLDTSGWTTVNEAAEKDAKKVINEFDNPIDAVKYHIDGSMDFKKSIVKVDMFTSGSLRESIKQLERPNLKPTMFIGFMDPEDVNRCEFKDLEKHVVYATDTGMLYSSFFNSFARRNEVSNIASSVDTLLNDLQNKKVTELHIPAHMKDCMILLESNERTIHSKGNVPMKLVCENGCYMNTYYSYFAIYEAFEFKKNMLFRNISEILLETFDGDETHFDFESIEVVQETFGSANINIRFRYDNEPFIIVVPTSSMKTSPGKIFHEGSRNEESEMNTDEETTPSSSEETTVEDNTPNENEEVKVEYCAGANGFGICYQEMDDSGLIKVNDVPHSKMYFGSCKDFGNNMLKLKNPRLFVTPFKGIASIFTTDRRRYNIPPGKSVNLAYDEWHAPDLEEPFEDIHVIVEGMPEYEDRTFESTGWIYGIDVDKLRDHIYQEPWMDSKKEFLIIDVPEIPIAEKLRVEPLIHVRGGEERKAPQGFNEYSLYHNHSVPLTENNVRKYMKNGTAEMTMPLQHLKLNDNVNGYIWDNRRGDITAYVAVEAKDDDKWIRAINTTRAYQEAGLYDYLLKFAEKELGADHIVVNESDYSLLSTCLEHDWIKYEESDGNIYLTKDNIYVEHTDPEDYEDLHDHQDDEDDIFNEAAYTNEGINKANVRPVMIVYKRFSTKNKEQLGPIAKMWEIANKYFPEPKMLSGFGWDWTGWETDFAYGIIINDRKIPEGFMEELRKEFPDITLDENFLIPKKYEEVYSCSESKMNEVYDKIWDKGFLECELEDYPSAGKMKISVIYKKDKAELDEEVAKHIKDVKKDEPIQEAFFGIGFGNLRKTIADRLGKYCTVTNVQNPTGKEEKFVIKLNEDPEDFVNVVSTGTGVKAYGYKHGERFSIFNNAALSAAAQRLIDAICDEFNIKLSLQEAFSMFINEDDEVSPRQ